MSAGYSSDKLNRNNRDSGWDPFFEATYLRESLKQKYGQEKKSFDTSDGPKFSCRVVDWEVGKTSIALHASTYTPKGMTSNTVFVMYSDVDLKDEYKAYSKAMSDKAYDERRKKEAEGL